MLFLMLTEILCTTQLDVHSSLNREFVIQYTRSTWIKISIRIELSNEATTVLWTHSYSTEKQSPECHSIAFTQYSLCLHTDTFRGMAKNIASHFQQSETQAAHICLSIGGTQGVPARKLTNHSQLYNGITDKSKQMWRSTTLPIVLLDGDCEFQSSNNGWW